MKTIQTLLSLLIIGILIISFFIGGLIIGEYYNEPKQMLIELTPLVYSFSVSFFLLFWWFMIEIVLLRNK